MKSEAQKSIEKIPLSNFRLIRIMSRKYPLMKRLKGCVHNILVTDSELTSELLDFIISVKLDQDKTILSPLEKTRLSLMIVKHTLKKTINDL